MRALVQRIRRRLLLHRRLLAALCAGVAVASVVATVRPDPPPTRPVVVAARALTAGSVLTAEDLTTADYPVAVVPAESHPSIRKVTGQTLAAPISAGEPITRSRLLGASMRRGYTGLVATPVRISDPSVVALLRIGDVVDVIAASGDPGQDPEVVASGARVIAVPPIGAEQRIGSEGALVLLGVAPSQAARAAAAPSAGYVTVVWDR